MSPFNIGDELVELRSRKSRAPGRPARRRLWLFALAAACVVGLGIVTFWLWGLRAPQGPALSTKALVRAAAAAPLRWAELRAPLPIASRIRREVPIAFVPKRGSDPFARDLPASGAKDRQEAGGVTLADVFAWQGDLGEETVGTEEPSDVWVGPDVGRVGEMAVGAAAAAGAAGATGVAGAAGQEGPASAEGTPAGAGSMVSSSTQEGLAQESLGSFDSDEYVAGEPQVAAAGAGADSRAQGHGAAAPRPDEAGVATRETGATAPSTQPSAPRAQSAAAPAPAPASAGGGAIAGPAGAQTVGGAAAGSGGPTGGAAPPGTVVGAPAAAAPAGGAQAPAGAPAVAGDEKAAAKQAAATSAKASDTGTKAGEAAPKAPEAGAKAADTGTKAAGTGTKAADTGTKASESGTKAAQAGAAKGAPAAGAAEAPRTITAPLVKLTGVITVDGRAYAIVRTPLGSWIVRPGDLLEGIAVRSIEQKRIVVEWQGEQFSVELGGGVER